MTARSPYRGLIADVADALALELAVSLEAQGDPEAEGRASGLMTALAVLAFADRGSVGPAVRREVADALATFDIPFAPVHWAAVELGMAEVAA